MAALSGISCQKAGDLFKSYGEETTKTRNVGEFNRISAGEKFDVILVQDSSKAGTIEITAGKNVIDGYTTEVNNGELQIVNDNKFNWVRKLKVRQTVVAYFKDLNHIQINGSAKFSCRDSIYDKNELEISHGGLEDADLKIRSDYIYINCTNTGGVNLSGSCFLMSASIDDISFINAKNMNAQKCYISSFSRDDSYVNGSEVLEIKLYGSGDIYYRQNPVNILNIIDTGEGNAIQY